MVSESHLQRRALIPRGSSCQLWWESGAGDRTLCLSEIGRLFNFPGCCFCNPIICKILMIHGFVFGEWGSRVELKIRNPKVQGQRRQRARKQSASRVPGLQGKKKKEEEKENNRTSISMLELEKQNDRERELWYLITPFSCTGSPFITLHFPAPLLRQCLIMLPNYHLYITYQPLTRSFLDFGRGTLHGQQILLAIGSQHGVLKVL